MWKFGGNNKHNNKKKSPGRTDRRTDWLSDWLRCASCVQAQIWPSSACCAGSVSRPRRLCSSTWRCTPASAATSAASATGPSPATLHSSATYAHTPVSEPLSSGVPRPGRRRCVYCCVTVSTRLLPIICPRPAKRSILALKRPAQRVSAGKHVSPLNQTCCVSPPGALWVNGLCCFMLWYTLSLWTHNPLLLKEIHQLIREAGRSQPEFSSPATSCPDHPLPPGQTQCRLISCRSDNSSGQFLLCGCGRILQETCVFQCISNASHWSVETGSRFGLRYIWLLSLVTLSLSCIHTCFVQEFGVIDTKMVKLNTINTLRWLYISIQFT